ncbi:hypothetical protein [Xanthomonas sp. GPE 39]|uniref:hypothetical protein n=1 Tax=Xanthomonas sp. GPE 39 TaxID=1583099 RepID=UPI0005F27985|nr:hypothetical protein [Xanthomonas sp. GPE 39]
MAKSMEEYANQAARWSGTLDQYQKELDHYQQQLINLPRLNFGDSTMPDSFPERPSDYGLADSCPGASQSGISGLLQKFTSIAANTNSGNAVDEQTKVCGRIVLAQNAQYNETVRMLKRLMQRNEQFKQLQAQRDSVGSAQGALAANDNETQRFVAQNAMDLNYWQAEMKAYDTYILALKDDQGRLSRKAMNGDDGKKLIGQVVQAGTLAAALSH